MWDPSLIDAVLISSPAGMLGLPFLARFPAFSATIYATEPTAKIGRLLMEDLVSMHGEYVRVYGPERDEEERRGLERLPSAPRDVVMGELGSWMPLYRYYDKRTNFD